METIAQSTKEAYKYDIEDSMKQKTLYKNFEYYDDHSYTVSDKIGILIKENKGKYEIILFQEYGPNTKEQLINLMRWRLSGQSDEVGHKGGGNKRNLYGFNADKFTILVKINDDIVLKCSANPKKILDFAKTDIDEVSFRGQIDNNEYVCWPEEGDLDDLPRWYENMYDNIFNESDIKPNYITRFELDELPNEYIKKDNWNEYTNQVRAKLYNVPIYFKNELLNMGEYKTYDNIDLVGFNSKENDVLVPLYLKEGEFYLFIEGRYINVNEPTIRVDNTTGFIHWGDINMYIVNEKYFNDQLKEFNKNHSNKAKADDFYGVYLYLNNKLTNYLPITGSGIPSSKNNKIYNGKCNVRFRMIFIPNNESCIDKDIFNSLIKTETIKALSGFLDKSPYKKIIKLCMDIYRGNDITKTKVKTSPKPKPPEQKDVKGCGYIVRLPCNLWKYGMVNDYKRLNDRIKEHINSCIEKVQNFTKSDIKFASAVLYYKTDAIDNYNAWEERVGIILNNYNGSGIKLFKSNSGSKDREYFICDNDDLITQQILPEIKNI